MGPGSGFACDVRLNTALTPDQRRTYQDPDLIREILEKTRTVAIVGLSVDHQKASYFVASYLKSEGYRIIPVTPRRGTILGEETRPTLRDVLEPVDLVDVFRPVQELQGLAEDTIAIGAKYFWAQLRIIDFAAAEKARGAGLKVVLDKCVKMEHARHRGSLHWAGMNTEIVTARRKTPGGFIDSVGNVP